MREIEFRAWIPKDHWVSENEGRSDSYVYGWQDTIYIDSVGFNPGEGIVIEQYTGLKDKNGAKIFEGDVLKHHRVVCAPDNHLGEPAFDDVEYIRTGHITINASKGVCINGTIITNDYNECKLISKTKYHGNPGCYSDLSVIIGNIHE